MRIGGMIVLLAGLCMTASAAVVLETAERDPAAADREIGTNVMRAADGRLRLERYEDEQLVALMIFKDDALYALDPAEKTYAVLDRATIQKVANVVNPALKEMQVQLEKMSPEQRAMVEQMMQGALPAGGEQSDMVREVVETDRTDRVADLDCRIYQVLENSALVRETCVVPPASVPGGQDFYQALSRMGALMQELLDSIDAPWLEQSIDDQWSTVEEMNGVPVRGREFENGKPVLEVVLTRIAEESAPTGSFDVPKGYTRRDLDQL